MMEALRKQGGGGGGGGGALGGLAGTIGSLAGSLAGGGVAGAAAGMLASYVLGAASMGGQVPVLCCDKQVDVYTARLSI